MQYYIDQEPRIQTVKCIRVHANRWLYKTSSFESDMSIFDSDYERQFEIPSVKLRKRKFYQHTNSATLIARLALRSRIQSFRLDEDISSHDDEESLPQDLMQVNLQYRHDAIVSVNKILQSKRQN